MIAGENGVMPEIDMQRPFLIMLSDYPARQRIQQFDSYVGILAPRARRHMKGMIGVGKGLQRRARTELPRERLQQPQFRKLVVATLQEQHRDPHIEEMLPALIRWSSGRMKRKSKEDEALNTR